MQEGRTHKQKAKRRAPDAGPNLGTQLWVAARDKYATTVEARKLEHGFRRISD